MKTTFSLTEIATLAKQILVCKPNKVILFQGEMGVGKTTLVKALASELGVQGGTTSPTYSFVNEYETYNHELLYHFDFYRIRSESEALDMGIDEYLYSGNWCFIEWSEKIVNLIPEQHTTVYLSVLSDGKRSINLV
jgi:tRNA threonylcarbamoyladenosine biosynthesis protein TsaE